MNSRVMFSYLENSNNKKQTTPSCTYYFVRICLALMKERESRPKKNTQVSNHTLLGILKERNKSRKSWDEDRTKTKPPRFFSINREQQQIKRDAMETQHSDTWDSFPKDHGSQPWGKGESAQSAQLRAGTSPVLEAGDSNAPAPALMAETAGTSIKHLYSKCWQRIGGRS